MAWGRISEIANKRRRVERLDLFERITDELTMPDDARRLLGLAPAHDSTGAAIERLVDAAPALLLRTREAVAEPVPIA